MAAVPKCVESHPTDEHLVGAAIDGDQAAMSSIYRRHCAAVAAVVYRMLGQDADLDDIVQETFVEGLRQLRALSDRSKLRSYLVTIAVRGIHKRLSFKYRLRGLSARLMGVAPTVSDPRVREEVHDLYRELARVAPTHRIAWVLHRVEGFSLPEVATHCQISLATTKRWIGSVDTHLEESDATG